MTPVEAVSTARFCTPSASATALRIDRDVVEPRRPGERVRVPGVRDDGADPLGGHARPRVLHRRRGGACSR